MPLSASFIGTWELDNSKSQGLEEYNKAMGFTEEQIQHVKSLQYTFTVSQDGDGYRLSVDFKGTLPNVEYLIKEGETIDYQTAHGRQAKLTLMVEDGNPVETYQTPDSDVTWVIRRSVEGDVMTVVTTYKEAVMTQFMNRV